jgi:hypothetical protein
MVIGSCRHSIIGFHTDNESNNRQDWWQAEKEGESLEYSIYEDQDRYIIKLKSQSRFVQARILALGLTVKIGRRKKNQTVVNYPIGLFEVRNFITPQQLLTFWEETKTVGVWKARLYRIKNIAYIKGLNSLDGYVLKDSISQVGLSYLLDNTEFIYELNIPKEKISHQEFLSNIGIEIGRLDVGQHYPNARFLEMRNHANYPDHLSKFSFKWEIWITGYEASQVL